MLHKIVTQSWKYFYLLCFYYRVKHGDLQIKLYLIDSKISWSGNIFFNLQIDDIGLIIYKGVSRKFMKYDG